MLAEEIERMRRKLVKLGMEKGLQHPEVLAESRNLDVLIVKFLVRTVAATN
ncbi:aspartyl-phosphate phosphatase Spo0E family protein [Propionispora vibrioides]|uniref:Spo0E like sporulation regulatory protein n=1 Tax=Propionispora vibrioides TaxID=112903 RepID=A0A1H8X7T6_9FIRM|nr:aspartyl-phosphate phosphatase Spo0E family protein [Propionispora vibrioides]SEP36000.1 Spo0E like sporulation regulatory protein [Propionispora vibrioides]